MKFKVRLMNLYIIACRTFLGVKKKTVFFESFNGKSYSDNSKAVSEALHKIAPELDIVWAFNNPEEKNVPDYIRKVSRQKYFSYYKEIARAGVWVQNCAMLETSKGKNQYYVQVWHGDRAFKKILWDSGARTEKQKPIESREGYCDIAVAGSEYGKMQYRSGFLYKGEILCNGTPRNDILVNLTDEIKAEKRKELGVTEGVHILLYAPTFRKQAFDNNKVQMAQDIDINSTLDALEKKYGGKWICFVRAHSVVKGISGFDYGDRIIDVSGVEDMADLLVVADMMISDYSSCAGDYALTKNPILLYQPDREQYAKEDRGFYFDIDDSPYYIATNLKEIEEMIDSFETEKVKQNCADILDFYKTTESGKASEEVAKLIKDHIDKA